MIHRLYQQMCVTSQFSAGDCERHRHNDLMKERGSAYPYSIYEPIEVYDPAGWEVIQSVIPMDWKMQALRLFAQSVDAYGGKEFSRKTQARTIMSNWSAEASNGINNTIEKHRFVKISYYS